MRSRDTQRDRILHLLQSRANEWVPLFEVTALAAQYSARIFELRGAGYEIRNRTEHRNGAVHSWFKLVVPKEQKRLFESELEPKRLGSNFLEPDLQRRLQAVRCGPGAPSASGVPGRFHKKEARRHG